MLLQRSRVKSDPSLSTFRIDISTLPRITLNINQADLAKNEMDSVPRVGACLSHSVTAVSSACLTICAFFLFCFVYDTLYGLAEIS